MAGNPNWKPGQSGNPKGRPPKARAMTALLERAGAKTVEMPDGKRIAGRRFVASAMWEMATTGQVTMPDGQVWKVTPAEWFDAVKWIYAQVDGPPKQALELSGGIETAQSYTDEELATMLTALEERLSEAGRQCDDANGSDQPV